MRLRDNRLGLTLVEMVVVMAVLSILAAVSMPILRVSVKRAKEMELRRDLRTMRDALDAYKKLYDDGRILREAGGSGYPKTLEVLVNGVDLTNTAPVNPGETQLPTKIKLLRSIPTDPMTGSKDWGMRSNADDPDTTTWGGQDVFDVFSRSDATALDGTKYSEW